MDKSAVLAFEYAAKSWSQAVARYCANAYAWRWRDAIEACE